MPRTEFTADASVSPDALQALSESLARHALGGADADLDVALRSICREAHALALRPEVLVVAMRAAWATVRGPASQEIDRWSPTYYAALSRCLAIYFEEKV